MTTSTSEIQTVPCDRVPLIDRQMQKEGFAEMRWLWRRFRHSRRSPELDPQKLEKRMQEHTGFLLRPWMALLAVPLASAAYQNILALQPRALTSFDRSMAGLLALLVVYAALFLLSLVQRTLWHDWKDLAADQLAFMLTRDYRAWLQASPRGRRVRQQLNELGVKDHWDSADYRVCYQLSQGEPEVYHRPSPTEFVQQTLRQVLGSKESGRYQPGRFYDHLKDKKRSVTRFVKSHGQTLQQSKNGVLPLAQGLELLKDLRAELQSNSAGEEYLDQAIDSLQQPDFLPAAVVEASIWKRDPWVDLTRAQDFYSSASLRGDSMQESLERRTKGALAPFSYLANPAISCLDFRTSEGRCVRARMAACRDPHGSLLFVDAVEGRFDIKPALLRRAIEDYARRAGFARVFYHAFPLNRVPRRFVKHVSRSTPLEARQIAFVDASQREYMDAFGLPLEPFEYAYPRGRVLGYTSYLEPGFTPLPAVPRWRIVLEQSRKKGLLWLLTGSTLACLSWMLYRTYPPALLPTLAALVMTLVYDQGVRPRLKRNIGSPAPNPMPRSKLDDITSKVAAHPLAQKMDYEPRLQAKIERLKDFLTTDESDSTAMQPFLQELLFNPSIKDTHLENLLRFLNKLDAEQRRQVISLFGLLWPDHPGALDRCLSEDKVGRKRQMKQLASRLDLLRRFTKSAPLEAWNPKLLRATSWALRLDLEKVLELVAQRPRILRGLCKPVRPVYAWLVPFLVGLLLLNNLPGLSLVTAYILFLLVVAGGTWWLATGPALAPGVLFYEKTRRRLAEVTGPGWRDSPAVARMAELGIKVEEFLKAHRYENKEKRCRIEIRDKRTLEGAMQFLTSSEEIGNCIALRNFVSWCLPSLFDDETIVLADVSVRGKRLWQQRAQLWMVAAQRRGRPVLAVNSLEFNNEGAKYLEPLMPEMVEVLKDVARRAGFDEIVVGISDFGRHWFDTHYAQSADQEPIYKVHSPELGGRYYFDSFTRHRQGYCFVRRRGLSACAYAVTFGVLERLKGNRAKAEAFFDTARNRHNCWDIPVEEEGKPSRPVW